LATIVIMELNVYFMTSIISIEPINYIKHVILTGRPNFNYFLVKYNSYLFLKKPVVLSLLLLTFYIPSLADKYPFNHAIDIQHYDFHLTLSDNTDQIIGVAEIEILFLEKNIFEFRLDLANKTKSRLGKGMEIVAINSEGNPLAYVHQGDSLMIQLKDPSRKESIQSFTIQYQGIPEKGLEIKNNHHGDRTFFCESWPNNTRHWLPTIDHPYEKTTVEFRIVAPLKYKVVSNGLLLEESQMDPINKLTHWKQSVPISCWLFVIGVAEFAVQEVDKFEGRSIQSWVYYQDREAGFKDFANQTKNVLQFFSNYVGPFAYEKLANVQSASVENGAMETASAILYSQNLISGQESARLRNVMIHEIAHQWFGNSVTESTWDDAWLSEGFATYFTLLFHEYQYGHHEYIKGLKESKKSVFDAQLRDPFFSVIADRTAETGPVISGLTYQKGAWFLHMLRNRIGHENFKLGIQEYYMKYFNGHADTGDFRGVMEHIVNEDLGAFFEQWLLHPDLLIIKGEWTFDEKTDKIDIKLTQGTDKEILFDMPVEFEIQYANGAPALLVKLNLNAQTQAFKIPSEYKPAVIVADPKTNLLASIDISEL
jgi:aminopeptidase N